MKSAGKTKERRTDVNENFTDVSGNYTDVNRVILVGTVEGDVSLAYSPKRVAIARLVVVTSEMRVNLEGKVVNEKVRHRVVMIGRQAERAKDYLRPGSRVHIEGRSKTRFKEIDAGRKIFITEVIGDCLEILGARNG